MKGEVTTQNTTKLPRTELIPIDEASDSIPELILRFSVSDTGYGISKENQENLFFEFKQIHAKKLQNGGGSGLGITQLAVMT